MSTPLTKSHHRLPPPESRSGLKLRLILAVVVAGISVGCVPASVTQNQEEKQQTLVPVTQDSPLPNQALNEEPSVPIQLGGLHHEYQSFTAANGLVTVTMPKETVLEQEGDRWYGRAEYPDERYRLSVWLIKDRSTQSMSSEDKTRYFDEVIESVFSDNPVIKREEITIGKHQGVELKVFLRNQNRVVYSRIYVVGQQGVMLSASVAEAEKLKYLADREKFLHSLLINYDRASSLPGDAVRVPDAAVDALKKNQTETDSASAETKSTEGSFPSAGQDDSYQQQPQATEEDHRAQQEQAQRQQQATEEYYRAQQEQAQRQQQENREQQDRMQREQQNSMEQARRQQQEAARQQELARQQQDTNRRMQEAQWHHQQKKQ